MLMFGGERIDRRSKDISLFRTTAYISDYY